MPAAVTTLSASARTAGPMPSPPTTPTRWTPVPAPAPVVTAPVVPGTSAPATVMSVTLDLLSSHCSRVGMLQSKRPPTRVDGLGRARGGARLAGNYTPEPDDTHHLDHGTSLT